MRTILAKKFQSHNAEEWRKFQEKNANKCVYKLNKQQTEQWRHLGNLAQLFFFTKIQF